MIGIEARVAILPKSAGSLGYPFESLLWFPAATAEERGPAIGIVNAIARQVGWVTVDLGNDFIWLPVGKSGAPVFKVGPGIVLDRSEYPPEFLHGCFRMTCVPHWTCRRYASTAKARERLVEALCTSIEATLKKYRELYASVQDTIDTAEREDAACRDYTWTLNRTSGRRFGL